MVLNESKEKLFYRKEEFFTYFDVLRNIVSRLINLLTQFLILNVKALLRVVVSLWLDN